MQFFNFYYATPYFTPLFTPRLTAKLVSTGLAATPQCGWPTVVGRGWPGLAEYVLFIFFIWGALEGGERTVYL